MWVEVYVHNETGVKVIKLTECFQDIGGNLQNMVLIQSYLGTIKEVMTSAKFDKEFKLRP